jgi:hypothetical protein
MEAFMEDEENRLAELAAFHVGLFLGGVSRLIDGTTLPEAFAHALWLLEEEARRRRKDY